MSSLTFSEEVRLYFSVFIRRAWLIGLFTLVAGGLTYSISMRMQPVYEATALVLIEAPSISSSADYTAVMTGERLAKTYAERMTTRPVLEKVIRNLGLGLDVTKLSESVSVQPLRDTQLIEVRVDYADPEMAARIANELVNEFSAKNLSQQTSRYAASKQALETQLLKLDQQINTASQQLEELDKKNGSQVERDRIETSIVQYQQTYASLLQSFEQIRLAEAQFTSNVVLEEPATAPVEPIRPRTLLNTVLLSLIGFLVILGIIFLAEALDDSVRNPDQITRQLGLPILGVIAHYKINGDGPVTSVLPRSPVSEAFRSLRTNIDFAAIDQPIRTLLMISPTPQEGKSTVTANLGIVLAQSGRRVLLVDGDLRRPALHKLMKLENHRGLSDLFLPDIDRDLQTVSTGLVCPTPVPGLNILTAGQLPANPAELMGSQMMRKIIEQLLQTTDILVIDSAPALAVTDAVVLASYMDGVVLVIKAGSTRLDACRQTIEQVKRSGAHLLGVVMNDVRTSRAGYPYYRYAQSYTYSEKLSDDEKSADCKENYPIHVEEKIITGN